MRRGYLGLMVIAGGFLVGATFAGCGSQPVVVEDRAHGDSHKWDSHEDAAYRQWEAARSKPHVDYDKRQAEEQSDYWNWRHSHS